MKTRFKNSSKMINILFLWFILITSTVTGKLNSKVSISQPDNKLKNLAENAFNKMTEVFDVVAKAGEKGIDGVRNAATEVGNMKGIASHVDDSTEGTLKDSVVKLEEWDPVDSPKRICEDIGQNASVKIERGVEEVKETVEPIFKNGSKEFVTKSKNAINDVSSGGPVICWGHLLGFSTAYGMGVWVTFFSGCVLGKCLPKRRSAMMLNTMNLVYFRVMSYCVGSALFGFLVRQVTRGVLPNKMEMFQGFNLVSALFMILINLLFLEPQATKLISYQRMKGDSKTKGVAAGKLKKINVYSSTLNVLTMVVLTWHLAYIGQLVQARY